MLPVKFRRAAKSELRDAARWYEERRAGLGGDFIHNINACLDTIPAATKDFSGHLQERPMRQREAFPIFRFVLRHR